VCEDRQYVPWLCTCDVLSPATSTSMYLNYPGRLAGSFPLLRVCPDHHDSSGNSPSHGSPNPGDYLISISYRTWLCHFLLLLPRSASLCRVGGVNGDMCPSLHLSVALLAVLALCRYRFSSVRLCTYLLDLLAILNPTQSWQTQPAGHPTRCSSSSSKPRSTALSNKTA
jgi:hypothetical protein